MSRIVLISDTHLGFNPLIDISVAVAAFKEAIDAAAATSTKTLVHAGDLTHEPRLDGFVLDAIAELLEYARTRGVQVWLLDGNHGLNNRGKSALGHLGVYSFDHVSIAAYDAIATQIADTPFVFLPFGGTVETARRVAAGMKNPVLVAHDCIAGAYFDNEEVSKLGFDPADIQNSTFRAVILGHIHRPQHLDFLSDSRICFYVGANLHFSFRAVGQAARGYVYYDVAANTYERVRQVGGRWPVFFRKPWTEIIPTLTLKDHKICYVTIDATEEDPSDAEIKDYVMSKGAKKVWVIRSRADKPKREARSTITWEDNHEVMAVKFANLILPEEKREPALAAHKRFVESMKHAR